MTEKIEKQETVETEKDQSETTLSIGVVIDNFVHRVLDIEECAKEFISAAAIKYNESTAKLKSDLTECQDIIDREGSQDEKLVGIRNLRKCLREFDRHKNSSPVDTLEKSLFINLFASFDKYIGDLIAVLYESKNDLYKNLNKEVPLSEVLSFDSMDELKQVILDKEIETIRRKSYAEQFGDLEKKFSIKLTKFDNWPLFIEAAQRRNLFTHCDGIVSKQYLDVCKSVNYKFEEEPEVGHQLEIGAKYFYLTCHIVTEVAVMLGQTLWRKVLEKDLENADSHLNELVFSFLHMEEWTKSIALSKFALNLPKIETEQMERIFHINYSIALKGIGKDSAAVKILDKKDWSATSFDFKLANAIIREEYDEAKEYMKRIGEQGELVSEMAYHDWPLFRDFREKPQFFEGYEEVFKYKYSIKLSSIADEKKAEASEIEDNSCAT